MAERYGEVNEIVRSLAVRFPKGKLSFVVRKREINTGIGRGIDTFGFRIPDNAFCATLTQSFGAPITATSANASGAMPARRVDYILAQLGSSAAQIDLVIDAGELPEVLPSTVVDCTREVPNVLREGIVPAKEIE
jgi:tRNA threonylcarbamoyl adenosine modification protein (Sua5/YciO/YrdC/YwlC family)